MNTSFPDAKPKPYPDNKCTVDAIAFQNCVLLTCPTVGHWAGSPDL